MYTSIPAVLRPSTLLHAVRANLTAEPKLLFVYALLLVVPWVLWQGHRTSDPDAYGEDGGPEDSESCTAPRETPSGHEGRRRKRRPGHIDRIQ